MLNVQQVLLQSNMPDLWPWDSHVQFRADSHTSHLLVMSTENLDRSRRQATREATLQEKKKRETTYEATKLTAACNYNVQALKREPGQENLKMFTCCRTCHTIQDVSLEPEMR